MKIIQTAKEYLIGCEHDGSYIPVNEVLRIIKVAQINAIEETCKRCAKEAKIKEKIKSTFYNKATWKIVIDKQSILKVADKMKEEIFYHPVTGYKGNKANMDAYIINREKELRDGK